ncbi:MAG: hypothetical protein ABSG04_02455 [Verrucomicrobiota bacterium]
MTPSTPPNPNLNLNPVPGAYVPTGRDVPVGAPANWLPPSALTGFK